MSHPIAALLIVEDNPGDARLIREMFDEHGIHRAGHLREQTRVGHVAVDDLDAGTRAVAP